MHKLNIFIFGPDSFISTLNELEPYFKFNISSDQKKLTSSLKGNLHGIIYHSGTTGGCHYTASVRKLIGSKYEWYFFNDNSTPKQKTPIYDDPKGYVLLYKIDKKWKINTYK